MAAKRKATKNRKSSQKSSRTTTSKNGDRDRDRGRDDDRGRDNDRGRGNGSGNRNSASSRNQDRFRLSGMWPAKNRPGMLTGTNKDSDIADKLRDLADKIEKGTGRLAVFMFENDRKRDRNDPDFTIYLDEGQEYKGGGRGRDGNGGYRGKPEEHEDRGRSRGRDIDRDDNRRDPDDNF